MPMDSALAPSKLTPRARLAAALLSLATGTAGCQGESATFPGQGGHDAGPTMTKPTSCLSNADCKNSGICTGGFCTAVTVCGMDSQCPHGQICGSHGYCVQCDVNHANACPMGQTCQFDYTCVNAGPADSGVPIIDGGPDGSVAPGMDGSVAPGNDAAVAMSCATRDDCPNDTVCTMSACVPPPARCMTPDDCPKNRPSCDGLNGVCFGGSSCLSDMDCANNPTCGNGACMCMMPGPGQPGTCVARPDECQSDADCLVNGTYNGRYCTVTLSPKRCLMAPTCTTDAQCAASALVCDTTMGSMSFDHCKNGTPCPTGTECTSAQICVNDLCVSKDCNNTPMLCAPSQMCEANGMCVDTMGSSCTSDAMCVAGQYCNTSVGACQTGCRDNSECMGGICNAAHTCQAPAGMFCGPCSTNADCPAGSNCTMNLFTGQNLCYETCSMTGGSSCSRSSAQCLFGVCTCVL
jgi:hypothetical protein